MRFKITYSYRGNQMHDDLEMICEGHWLGLLKLVASKIIQPKEARRFLVTKILIEVIES